MKILHQIDTLNANDGGPTRSVFGLCNSQLDLGHEVCLVCTESDLDTSDWNFQVVKNGKALKGKDWIELCSKFEVVHSHGLWRASNHSIAKAAYSSNIPIVVSPRGMLQKWAMNHHRIKKLIAWNLYQNHDLKKTSGIIVTAPIEAMDVLDLLPDAKIFMLPNGIENQGYPKDCASEGVKRALFLSRIHSKKGIEDLISAWVSCEPKDWELIVAGPDSDKLWEKIKTKYRLMTHSIRYVGPVDGAEKGDLYRSADLFILPTYSENFGLVVPEALSVGTPVLTTTGTPWNNLPELGCGWCIDPGKESLNSHLPRILMLSKQQLFEMGRIGSRYIKSNFSWQAIARLSIHNYEKVVRHRD